jgi:histone deacetylase 1/2
MLFTFYLDISLKNKVSYLVDLQIDCGGEFFPFTQFLTPLGITHRLTCPHTHQNGSVERKHIHIVETGLTLLAHAKLPLHFWDHAFLTATYLINRLPSPTLDYKSPFFILNLQLPDYKFLKTTFGCACFPFLTPYHNQKMNCHS